MRFLFVIILSLALCACGEDKDSRMTCAKEVDVELVEYPDGVTRKSEIEICTNPKGRRCVWARWVNDANIAYVQCTGGST